jgi:hypothetical protein
MDIYQLCKSEEANYKLPIPIIDGYEWSMHRHIRQTVLYKNSQLESGKNEGKADEKPVKNIIRPILNLQYRSEGFDVKDIELFVNSPKDYYKSLLVRKFHEKWARENNLDTFIDEMVESFVDFGGALVKNINSARPEVVPLQSIAFCDQTDMLSGPLGIKHNYSPDQLMEMESKGWGKFGVTLQDLIELAEHAKEEASTGEGQKAKTPGKYIEVYEIHGMFPKSWSTGEPRGDDDEAYTRQLHIIAYYGKGEGRSGVTLYRGKEAELPFKLILRDKIFGRALGLGGAEELFEPQVWVNLGVIRIKDMLDAAAKKIFKTTDAQFATRNKTTDLENNEILVLEDGKDIAPLDTSVPNVEAIENNVVLWEEHARQMGGANEVALGEQPNSGTPFKLQELITQENNSIHLYRQGKLATFTDEIYRDWVLPYAMREISKGQEFLAELDLDELQGVADSLVTSETNKAIKERIILKGELMDEAKVELFKTQTRDQFMKGGNKRFMKIAKAEFASIPVDVYTNIVGKQKDLSGKTDKLVNIFRQLIAAPQILDDPRMAKIFNEILEASGLSPVDFYQKPPQQVQPQDQQQPLQSKPSTAEPLLDLAKAA